MRRCTRQSGGNCISTAKICAAMPRICLKSKPFKTDDVETPYRYTLYINYDGGINDDIPGDFAVLTAKLYNDSYENGSGIVDQDELSNALSLVEVTARDGTVGRALQISCFGG